MDNLILTIATSDRAATIQPYNGLWTVTVLQTEKSATKIIADIIRFEDALLMAAHAVYDVAASNEASKTLKTQVVGGLAGPMMEEYQTQADRVLQARDML